MPLTKEHPASQWRTRAIFEVDLRNLAERLLSLDTADFRNHVQLSPAECLTVCHLAIDSLKKTSACLTLKSPVNVIGDLHGQFHDLLRIFDALGKPPESRFLFLGDYVDRGKYSLEVMTLLLVLMLLYPGSVFLLRGNHETSSVCYRYGFRLEIMDRFHKHQAHQVYNGFLHTFQWLPLCAIVDNRLFCCHGGLSPSLLLPPYDPSAGWEANVNYLNSQQCRPLEPRQAGLAMDLLWADPIQRMVTAYFDIGEDMQEAKWIPSCRRQCSYQFSGAALLQAMRVFGTQVMIRGHQLAQNGYRVSLNRRCITLFSAPGYCGVESNSGGVLQMMPATKGSQDSGTFFLIKPVKLEPNDLERLFWLKLTDSG